MMHEPTSPTIVIAVSGAGDTGHCGPEAMEQAKVLGREIAEHHAILAVGAGTGFPLWVALGAREAGGLVIGFSPAANAQEHTDVYRLPLDHIGVPIFTGFGYTGRDLLMVRSSHAVLFGCGTLHTVSEFTLARDEGKPLGILKGDWTSDEVFQKAKESLQNSHELIISDADPRRLVEQMIRRVKETLHTTKKAP